MLALGRCPEPARAQAAEVRVLTLRIVAEEMYRARLGWEADGRRTVRTVSDIYERAFQIRFVIQDTLPPIPSYLPQSWLTLSGVFRYRVVSEPDAPPPPPAR